MALIEGKYYRCRKEYSPSGKIIFKEGYLYKLETGNVLVGENRWGLDLDKNDDTFLRFFYESPFDENTGPYPPAQPLFELLPGRKYICKKSLKMDPPHLYTAFYENRVYKAVTKKSLINERLNNHELSFDVFNEYFEPTPLPISVSETESSIPSVLNFYGDAVPFPIEDGKFYSLGKGATVSLLPQYPKVMEVSDFPDFPKPLTRVVFMEKKGSFYVWNNAKTIEEAEKEFGVSRYKFACEVSPVIEVSKKEIAEWKGVQVDQLLIIE